VGEIEQHTDSAAIATAIIKLGQSLGMAVVAEGVETRGQLEFLREQGCQIVQGYYLGRPAPPEQLAQVLQGMDGLLRKAG
jgi:EAL domain-containing protein (putative c-di-GMP-specific phosphodiesterase class I)